MTTAPVPGRSVERRAELLDAAARVIRSRGPDASMEAIAAEAGITKPILYRHFGDRAGLCLAVVDRALTGVMENMSKAFAKHPPGSGLIAASIDAYLRFIDEDENLYRFLMTGG